MKFFQNGFLTKSFCPPVETDPNTGEAKVAQVGLRRVEGALLQGYKRDEILTVNPDYIEKINRL